MIHQFNKNNFDSALFDTDERDTISIFFRDEKDRLCVYNLDVDPKDPAFQHLLSITTLEQIEENTINHIRALQDEQQEIVKLLMERGAINVQTQASYSGPRRMTLQEFLDTFFATEEEIENEPGLQETLFEFKLLVFDQPEVLNADTETKEAIRLSKTPLELVKHLISHQESYNAKASDPDDTDQV